MSLVLLVMPILATVFPNCITSSKLTKEAQTMITRTIPSRIPPSGPAHGIKFPISRMLKLSSIFVAIMGMISISSVGGEIPACSLAFLASPSGWVCTPQEPVSLTLSRTGSSERAELQIVAVDFHGNVVFSKKEVMEKGSASKHIRLDIGRPGYFTVTATLSGTNGNGRLGEATHPLAIIPSATTISNDRNPFGVNFHLTRISVAEAERELNMARRIGFGWGRGMLFDWSDLQAPPDFKNPKCFAQWDSWAALVKKAGLSCLASVYYMPKWASGAPANSDYIVWNRCPPDDLTPLTNFCEAMARNFPFVKYWEVGNECDMELFWRGRWKNFLAGDDIKIINDYVDFLAAASTGFRQGNPSARILFVGITGAGVDGATYRPFVEQSFKRGAGRYIDIMNTHYSKNLPELRAIMKKTGNGSMPVWITEAGGTSAGTGGDRAQIVQDITQAVVQLASGAERIFKYDFRNDGEAPLDTESNFGLVRRDFSPKPAYVAYATLIRLMADATFKKELNITTQTDHGWLRGYEFSSPSQASSLNCIWLNDAGKGIATLRTPAQKLVMIDLMGNASELETRGGTVRVETDGLPFFILGPLSGNEGKIKYPADELVRTIAVPLSNPSFESEPSGGSPFPGWASTFGNDCKLTRIEDRSSAHGGSWAASIHVPPPGRQDGAFPCVSQGLDCGLLRPTLNQNEYLKVRLEGWVKCTGVTGRGVTMCHSFYDKTGARMPWTETSYRPGTYNWRHLKLDGIALPAEATRMAVELYMASATYGQVEWDDLSMFIEIWRKTTK